MNSMNILHVFTDQQRFDTVGRLGNPIIRTPALDRLVDEGTTFRNAFTPSPVCVPARVCMTTGLHPQNTGCLNNSDVLRVPEDQTFMSALQNGGYQTHGIGKCHFEPDSQALRGFVQRERSEEIFACREDDDYAMHLEQNGYGHVGHVHGMRSEMYYVPQPAAMPAALHPTQWVGDRAVEFIRQKRDSSEPWYLYAGFIHPHPPFAVPVPWNMLYRAYDMPLPHRPTDFENLQYFILHYQNRYKYRDGGFDRNMASLIKAYYYAAISFIDYQVGRMLDCLEKAGELDNTMIVFTADHGEYLGDYGCYGKRGMHDASSRIPLIVRHPGSFEPGTRCEQPVSLIDLAPTFINAGGVKTEMPLDGVDLREVAAGNVRREIVFSQYNRGRDAVYMAVSRDWKYVYSAADGKEFLFDRLRDPMETRNCLHTPGKQEPLEKMKSALIGHLEACGHTEGLDGKEWRQYECPTIPANTTAWQLTQDPSWMEFSIQGYSKESDKTEASMLARL